MADVLDELIAQPNHDSGRTGRQFISAGSVQYLIVTGKLVADGNLYATYSGAVILTKYLVGSTCLKMGLKVLCHLYVVIIGTHRRIYIILNL